MEEHMSIYLEGLELAFSAPEPLRRNFVDILRQGTVRTAQELRGALSAVRQQHVTGRN